jgi:multiple sugar transport system permease protein
MAASMTGQVDEVQDPVAKKRKYRIGLSDAIRLAILIALAVVWASPVVWMILTSFKHEAMIVNNPHDWLPSPVNEFTVVNYDSVLFTPRGIDLIQSFVNSLVVATSGALLTILITVPAGYVFARMDFPGRNFLFVIVVASLIVPGEILLIPNYVTTWKLGWLNGYEALIIPPLASAFGVFLMRQFMLGIPRELEEAAKLDGANHFRILWNIVIPSTTGPIAALGIFTFLNYWNEFTWPYITINVADRMTLPVALIQFRNDYITNYGELMAGAAISSVPAIIVFLFAQRMIIRSITLTGIKG